MVQGLPSGRADKMTELQQACSRPQLLDQPELEQSSVSVPWLSPAGTSRVGRTLES
jgi:hypothetical protein